MLADHATDVIMWYALDGTILYVSPSATSLGYTPDQMVGRNAVDFMHPDDRAHTRALIEDMFDGGPVVASQPREGRFLTGDGRCIWLEGTPTLIRDVDGAPTSAVTSLRDVTARRQLEDDLKEAKARAEAAVEAKAEFLANMSHEVRTPLTAVLGFAGLLETMEALPAEARAHIRRIVAGGGALLAVVNDILDFSKLEAGQVELDLEPFEVRPFFEDTQAMFADQAAAKGLGLKFEIEAGAPAFLAADRARLGQILGNLISNAIKFTDAGGVSVTAAFDAEQGRLRVAVADTGPGIAADKLDRLFQRFSQVDGSVSRRHGGTGLGLAISQGLAELMGGAIEVASRVGVGSTFTLCVAATPAQRAPTSATLAHAAPDADAGAARILVVDDLDVNRMLARAILEAAGHRVVEAGGGPEAISAALGGVFNLILMDLQMPGMDGYAAARAIRALPSENRMTPIVALSANVLATHVSACGAAGMNDHLAKPIVPADLLAAVARWAGVRLEHAGAERLEQLG
jgi:PAS domain S-box-containing protein